MHSFHLRSFSSIRVAKNINGKCKGHSRYRTENQGGKVLPWKIVNMNLIVSANKVLTDKNNTGKVWHVKSNGGKSGKMICKMWKYGIENVLEPCISFSVISLLHCVLIHSSYRHNNYLTAAIFIPICIPINPIEGTKKDLYIIWINTLFRPFFLWGGQWHVIQNDKYQM